MKTPSKNPATVLKQHLETHGVELRHHHLKYLARMRKRFSRNLKPQSK